MKATTAFCHGVRLWRKAFFVKFSGKPTPFPARAGGLARRGSQVQVYDRYQPIVRKTIQIGGETKWTLAVVDAA
jgi:hypothetical protein